MAKTNKFITAHLKGNAHYCFEVDMTESGDSWYQDGLAWQRVQKKYEAQGWTKEVADFVANYGSDIEHSLKHDLNMNEETLADEIHYGNVSEDIDYLEKQIAGIEEALEIVRKERA